MGKLKGYFITGILVLLPLIITIYILQFLFTFVDGLLAGPLELILGRYYFKGVGFVITVVLILLIGMLATNIVGRKLIGLVDTILVRIPLVKGIYTGVKQITDAFSIENRSAFQKVALVEYPHPGTYALGFITSRGALESHPDMVSIFLPTTPNPTSGFLLFLPKESVTPLDISVEDGLKLIISGGVVKPGIERGEAGSGRWE